MNPNQFKSLKILSDCPVCGQKHFPSQIKIICENMDGHLIHVQCKNCQSCIVIVASFGGEGVNVLGVLTDLNSEEIKNFIEQKPITADDVLNLNEIINKNEFIKEVIN